MSVLDPLRGTAPALPGARRRPRIEVWQVGLDVADADLAEAAALLTPAERDRADRGTAAVRRRRIALRAALRTVLGQELGCAPADVPLSLTPAGRPRLDVAGARWDVNCAGSDGVGLVALARGLRVGVDLERVVPWTEAAAREGWLSPRELGALRALPASERDRAATRCWTQKEAVLKAIGSGLSRPPVSVPTSPGRRSGRARGWLLLPVAVPPAFEASLACSARFLPRVTEVVPRQMPSPTETTAGQGRPSR